MGTDEKKLGQKIAEAVSILPDEKREYILGYAEGVIAMAEVMRKAGPLPEQRITLLWDRTTQRKNKL